MLSSSDISNIFLIHVCDQPLSIYTHVISIVNDESEYIYTLQCKIMIMILNSPLRAAILSSFSFWARSLASLARCNLALVSLCLALSLRACYNTN